MIKTMQDTVFSLKNRWSLAGKTLDWNLPVVMGILNVTPDSFYDGGWHTNENQIIKHAEKMLEAGAGIIDVGACSTRPGAKDILEEEELGRLIPVIKALKKHFPDAVLSADTYRAGVAEQAVECGADIINDVSGGSLDEELFSTIVRLKVPYVLTHIQGTPPTMQMAPQYENIISEVHDYFQQKINWLQSHGVEKIMIDPGFGFGKNLAHNFTLLKQLSQFKKWGYPLLAGISRKSMINKVLGTTPSDALNGTTVLHTIALLNGANLLRVHDVKEAIEAIKLVNQYLGS